MPLGHPRVTPDHEPGGRCLFIYWSGESVDDNNSTYDNDKDNDKDND